MNIVMLRELGLVKVPGLRDAGEQYRDRHDVHEASAHG